MAIDNELISEIISQYPLNLHGLHGIDHWARVYQNGMELAKLLDFDPQIIELFAVIHDSKRITEVHDEHHGLRAAEFAKILRGKFFELSDPDFDILYNACQHHTKQINSNNPVIQSCWDSDRLDLGRCGVMIDLDLIGTHTYNNDAVYKDAYERGINRDSAAILKEWFNN